MRRLLFIAPLLLAGCGIFSTPGKVTSSMATTEAGGVYGSAIQPANGYGCPSIVGQGAQTMGSMSATCTDHGANQSITLTAPDPNPALTTAYQGINQQMATLQAIIAGLLQTAGGLAAGPAGSAAVGAVVKPPVVVPPLPSTVVSGQGVTTTP